MFPFVANTTLTTVTTSSRSYGNQALVYIHEHVARARQLVSVAQLVRALHRNRRAAGSIPARDIKLHFSLLFLVRSNKCL